TGGKAWGLQQTTGTNATEAVRYLPATLAVNQTVSVDMDNKNITRGGSAGINLQDGNTTKAFEFKFRGGDGNYNINDSRGNLQNTGLPFTSTGLHLDYTLTSPSNYSLTIRRLSDGSTMTLAGTNISGVSIKRVRFFDFQFGAGNNIYFNNLVV